jgi:hypothetical protein
MSLECRLCEHGETVQLPKARNEHMTTNEPAVGRRVAGCEWPRLERELDAQGYAVVPRLLDPVECAALAAAYHEEAGYRRHIVMAQHGYGRGDYKYYAYPLPPLVQALRGAFYEKLAPIANRWNESLNLAAHYPATHAEYLDRCHARGQLRPTPLILHYGPGDYNRLHQDLYGDELFPLQLAVLLSQPGRDFEGGEFVLTEQRPRMQSRVEVVPLRQGDAVIFAVNHRPEAGVRGMHRVAMRHGVSRLRSGERFTLGVIFHDAK